MRLFLVTLFLLKVYSVSAQFNIPDPIINSGQYLITDTVYMDPNGNDSNPGTFISPVLTFQAAIQKLPFGTAGVNGGHAYGLVMLKPGFYASGNGMVQSVSQWKNGNVYKNVSIEGIGSVTIGGSSSSFATGHVLQLRGDHIFIKNLRIAYSSGIGLLLGRAAADGRQSNVQIEDVHVDSVGNFSMLIRNVDTVLVKNSSSLYSARPGQDTLTTPCQWPSGIKFLNTVNAKIFGSEVAYSRGEGLNFQNSQLGEAFRNILHNNPLNFYNDNSGRLSVHHNMIYNTPGLDDSYWRTCPGNTNPVWAGQGMLIANEGSCDNGNGPVYENCRTKCVFPEEYFPNVDSMFVFNNVFQNTGEAIGFWQGTLHVGVNCIRNVFIFNNTIAGVHGMPGAPNEGLISFFFPDYNVLANSFYSYLQNVKITNNIFTYDTAGYTNMQPVRKVFHALHPGPQDIEFSGNLWVKTSPHAGTTDLVRPSLRKAFPSLTDSLSLIRPCDERAELIYNRPNAYAFMFDDYTLTGRTSPNTNAGALEYKADCNFDPTGITGYSTAGISVYPNPVSSRSSVMVSGLQEGMKYTYELYDLAGKCINRNVITGNSFEAEVLNAGLYIVLIKGGDQVYSAKLIVTE